MAPVLVPLRPSSEHILIVRAPGARDQHGCHSTLFTVRVLRARRAPGRSLSILLRPRVARAQEINSPPFHFSSLPLDAAADASLLVPVDRLPGERRIDRGAQIAAGYRLVAAWATVVELPAVEQPPVPIEQIEIRGAGCPIGLRHVLGLVKAEGKGEA